MGILREIMGILRVKLWVFLMMVMVWLWSGYGSLLADLKKTYVFLNTYAEKIVFLCLIWLRLRAITSNYALRQIMGIFCQIVFQSVIFPSCF